ncbi:MAG TPA: potassium/proton antiporter [Firmicutes bacterium]|nr:potassium/proton antiporter [Bacillota bacterium]
MLPTIRVKEPIALEEHLFTIIRAIPIEYLLFAAGLLIFASVATSKLAGRLGVPVLLIFMLVGILAGSEGPGGFYFDDAWLAQLMGTIALAIILFAGGMSTDWNYVKPVFGPAVVLATAGVAATAGLMGLFNMLFLRMSFLEAMLLGSVISSTDAAAVFGVLRTKRCALKGTLSPLLELESGMNDPMAIFLTMGLVHLITNPGSSFFDLISLFFTQMFFGITLGLVFGWLIIRLLNRIKLEFDGMYPVLLMSLVIIVYAITAAIKGSGFLAVYIMGIYIGNSNVIHKRSLVRFSDAMAWLMQILMFMTMGLLVFPSQLAHIIGIGLLLSFILMFIARPVAMFLMLAFYKFSLKEKLLISWVGLRGAVPIVLATIPLLAGVNEAQSIFNVVFFVVLTSAALQGSTIPMVAKWLGLGADMLPQTVQPLELNAENINSVLAQIFVEPDSFAAGRELVELKLPPETLVVLIERNNQYIVPTGRTRLEAGDRLTLLGNSQVIDDTKHLFASAPEKAKTASPVI